MYDKTLVDTPEKALVIINELLSINKQQEIEIEHYKYDELTSLLLRKDHNAMLKDSIRELTLHGIPFMYANLDMNGLKKINTNEGYVVGDSYIKSIAVELIHGFRDSHIYRIGGDEFAIIRKGDCVDDFDITLAKINNVEYGSVCVNSDTDLRDIDSIVTYVDSMIIKKKAQRKNRHSD